MFINLKKNYFKPVTVCFSKEPLPVHRSCMLPSPLQIIFPDITSSPRGQVWSSRPQEPVLGTQRARLCPAHGLVKGSVDLSWAHPKDVSQAHEPFWESFPVRPGLAFFLSSLQRVRGTQAAPLSPLCVEEGGLGALPDPGLI